MSDRLRDINAYAEAVSAMSQALGAGDTRAFRVALSSFDTVRDTEVMTGIRKVAVDLQSALERFEIDSRLIGLAQQQVPDARRRLAHVLKLTADAAHQTMDLVEQCSPLADRVAQRALRLLRGRDAEAGAGADTDSDTGTDTDAGADDTPLRLPSAVGDFLRQTTASMEAVCGKLAEVRLAQSYQDLTGQIVRGVMDLVDELERALGELARIAVFAPGLEPRATSPAAASGPVVPGVDHGDAMSGQQDVDALLSGLGI